MRKTTKINRLITNKSKLKLLKTTKNSTNSPLNGTYTVHCMVNNPHQY